MRSHVPLAWGRPNANAKNKINLDSSRLEGKESERLVIKEILKILCEKQMLSSSDFSAALKDLLEFMNDYVIDIPKAYENMAHVLATLVNIHAVKTGDLIKICQDLGEQAVDGNKLLSKLADAVRADFGGVDAVKTVMKEADVLQIMSKEEFLTLVS